MLNLRVEGYRKFYRRINPRFENLFDPLVLLPEMEFDRVMIEPDGARGDGLEILMRVQSLGAWSGWLGYTWSRIEDRVDGRHVPRSWDQRHAVNLGINWSSGPWAATITNSFHTGWPTTQLQLSGTTSPQVTFDPRNSSRFATYNSLDFRVTRTFTLPRGVLDVFVETSNALDSTNPCCVQYKFSGDANGMQTVRKDVDNWLPLVPSAGVLWRY